MTVETARKVLYRRTLRFQSPTEFNDPFDTQWDTLWALYTPEALEYRRELLRSALRDPSSCPDGTSDRHLAAIQQEHKRFRLLPDDERDGAIRNYVEDLIQDQGDDSEFHNHNEDVCQRSRVCCLSQCNDNILMWSHYAANHRGVVLAFHTAGLARRCQMCRFYLKPIQYHEALPPMVDHQSWARAEMFGIASARIRSPEQFALAKHAAWSYEREWRFGRIEPFGTSGSFVDAAVLGEWLVDIVAGCRTDLADFDYLLHLARKINPDIKSSRMSPHESEFRLVKRPYDPSSPD